MLLNGSGPLDGAPLDGEEAVYARLKTSSMAENVTVTDSGRELTWDVTITATLTLLDQFIAVSTGSVVNVKVVGDVISLSDGFTRTVFRGCTLSDALTIADTRVLAKLRNIVTTENVSLLDALLRYAFRGRVMQELTIAVDAQTKELRWTRSNGELVVATDSHTGHKVKNGLITDTVSVTDIGRMLTWEIVTEAGIMLIDQMLSNSSSGAIVTRIATDTVLVTDSTSRYILRGRTLLEAVTMLDTLAGRDVSHTVSATETIDVSDSFLARRLRTFVSTEGITLVDFIFSNASSIRTITTSDSIVVFDQTIRSVQRTRFTQDAIAVNEQMTKRLERIRSVLEGVFFDDGQLKIRQYNAVLNDYVVLSDEAAKQIVQAVLYDVRIIIGVGMDPVIGTEEPILIGTEEPIVLGAYN